MEDLVNIKDKPKIRRRYLQNACLVTCIGIYKELSEINNKKTNNSVELNSIKNEANVVSTKTYGWQISM